MFPVCTSGLHFHYNQGDWSQNSIHLNKYWWIRSVLNESVFVCMTFVSAQAHPKSMIQSCVIVTVIYNTTTQTFMRRKNKPDITRNRRQTDAVCQQLTGRHIILLNVLLRSVFGDDTRVSPNKHWQPSYALSQGIRGAAIWVYFCGSPNVSAVVPNWTFGVDLSLRQVTPTTNLGPAQEVIKQSTVSFKPISSHAWICGHRPATAGLWEIIIAQSQQHFFTL